jgi:hypothetical protein
MRVLTRPGDALGDQAAIFWSDALTRKPDRNALRVCVKVRLTSRSLIPQDGF